MSLPSWDDLARSIPLPDLVVRLGLQRGSRKNRYVCPQCQGPDLTLHPSGRWSCWRCDEHGRGPALVSFTLSLTWREVADWYRAQVGTELPDDRPAWEEPTEPPPQDEVMHLLHSCSPVALFGPVWAWMQRRGIDPATIPAGCVRSLVRGGPVWARLGRRGWYDAGYRSIYALTDASGAIRNVRVRTLADAGAQVGPPKALSPAGIGGLCLTSRWTRAWLAGTERAEVAYVVEGEPAWLAWSAAAPEVPVLGIVSGSARVAWMPVLARADRLVVVVDDDQGGAQYWSAWSVLHKRSKLHKGPKDRPEVA